MRTVLSPLVLSPPPDDTLTGACGEQPSWVCEATWNLTERSLLTRAIDWFVARPLAAVLVLVLAAVLDRWLRRLVSAVVTRAVNGETVAAIDRLSGANRIVDARQEARAHTVAAVACAMVSALVWTIAVLSVLSMFDLDLGPLVASAGIAAVALGFGAQSLVRDCIAGFFILLEDQFGVGDEIEVGLISGTVDSLTLRMTRVRGANGTLWSVPNGTILQVGNRSRNWSKGFIDVMVRNDADLDRAVTTITDAVREAGESEELAARLTDAPEVLGVDRVGAEGTAIRVAIKTAPGDHVSVMRSMRLAIKRRLDLDGIPLPPTGPESPGIT